MRPALTGERRHGSRRDRGVEETSPLELLPQGRKPPRERCAVTADRPRERSCDLVDREAGAGRNVDDVEGGDVGDRLQRVPELDGDGVRLAVSDNGGGFPEELMARIFEPYVTTKPRGTGLGLAIVKKIIDEHHGSVAIENRPSRGASVSVLLPLAKAA